MFPKRFEAVSKKKIKQNRVKATIRTKCKNKAGVRLYRQKQSKKKQGFYIGKPVLVISEGTLSRKTIHLYFGY